MPIHDWTRVEAGIFHDFHHEWSSAIKHALNAGILPADFYALVEQKTGGPEPEVVTLGGRGGESHRGTTNGAARGTSRGGGISIAARPPRARFKFSAKTSAYVRKQKRITVRHVSGDNVVAVIEIVSPGNKSSQNALDDFVKKSIALLRSGIHLTVLDLLPPSRRDPQGINAAIWSDIGDDDFKLPPDARLTLASYAAGQVTKAYIEPVAIGDLLPKMPVFLKPRTYVPLPLEATYQSAFAYVPPRWRAELEPPIRK